MAKKTRTHKQAAAGGARAATAARGRSADTRAKGTRAAGKRAETSVADVPATTADAAGSRAEPASGRWTFLTNHSHVLIVLARNPSIVLREVAAEVGITERAVQRIIADLEEESIIEREKVGRQNRYRILADKPLRHPVEAHRTVSDLLRIIDGSQ